MNGDVFVTPHRGLSAFLLYVLGTDAIRDVLVEHPRDGRKKSRISYQFQDDGTCANLAREFFHGAGVSDAKGLLECAREINHQTTDAYKRHQEQIEFAAAEGKR